MTSFFTAVELNTIVFRYFHDSGFEHAAFSLRHEARIDEVVTDGNLMIPRGSLVKLMHRGLRYIEMQANSTNDDNDGDREFVLLKPMDLITKDLKELRAIVRQTRRNMAREREARREAERDRNRGKENATRENSGIWNWNRQRQGRSGGRR